MNLFLLKRIYIQSGYDIENLKNRLLENTVDWAPEISRKLNEFKNGKLSDTTKFEVKLRNNIFTIRKRIDWRYSNISAEIIVKGEFRAKGDKTEIAITFRPRIFTVIFLSIWAFLTLFIPSLSGNINMVLFGIILFGIPYFIHLYGFNNNLIIYERLIQRTFCTENKIDGI